MAKAVFIASHTPAYAGGFAAVAAIMILWHHGWPMDSIAAKEIAYRYIGVIVLSLMEAALFALGIAWADVPRLPGRTWAFAAGIALGVGAFSLEMWSDPIPPCTNMRNMEQRGYRAAIDTAYVLLAPIVEGIICGWLWKRTR